MCHPSGGAARCRTASLKSPHRVLNGLRKRPRTPRRANSRLQFLGVAYLVSFVDTDSYIKLVVSSGKNNIRNLQCRRLRRPYITPVVRLGCELFYGRLSGSGHNDLICPAGACGRRAASWHGGRGLAGQPPRRAKVPQAAWVGWRRWQYSGVESWFSLHSGIYSWMGGTRTY